MANKKNDMHGSVNTNAAGLMSRRGPNTEVKKNKLTPKAKEKVREKQQKQRKGWRVFGEVEGQ